MIIFRRSYEIFTGTSNGETYTIFVIANETKVPIASRFLQCKIL